MTRSASARLLWLDLARGLAVVSMVIAHTCPWGRPSIVTEYLTAPWFAMLIGMSLVLAWEKTSGRAWHFLLASLARGLLLIGVGELLQRAYYQIDIVLQTLGLLTIVLAPLVVVLGRRTRAWAGIAVLMVAASPLLMAAGREWLAAGGADAGWPAYLLDLTATGLHYRVTTFVAIAAAGIAALPSLLAGRAAGRRGMLVAGALGVAAGLTYLAGRLTVGATPYSGTWPEILGAILLSLGATWGSAWLVSVVGRERVRAWLGAVVDTGRMALTAYAVQVLALAAIVRLWLDGGRDDHWQVMVGVIALCLTFSWAWLKVLPIGPLEWVLRLPGRGLTRVTAAGEESVSSA